MLGQRPGVVVDRDGRCGFRTAVERPGAAERCGCNRGDHRDLRRGLVHGHSQAIGRHPQELAETAAAVVSHGLASFAAVDRGDSFPGPPGVVQGAGQHDLGQIDGHPVLVDQLQCGGHVVG